MSLKKKRPALVLIDSTLSDYQALVSVAFPAHRLRGLNGSY